MVSRTLASALKKAKNLGRRGDTMLAHINTREADILKSLGGSGTINPHTGLPEFADDSSSSNQSPSYSGGNYSNYTGGSDLGGYSGSGNTTYSGGGGGGTTSSGNMGGYIGGGGGGGSMAAARAADRSSVYGYSSDPYSSNSYVMGSMDNATPYNPMGPAGLSGSMVRGVLNGASGFANALSAGAGKVASFGDTLSGIFSNAQPSISSLGNEVSQGLINASDALNQGLSTGYNYARDYINNALSPSAPQGQSYTQMAASGNPAPEYTSPSDFMTPSVPSWQALPNPTTPMGRLPDGTVVTPQAERDYWNQQQNTFGQQLLGDQTPPSVGPGGRISDAVASARAASAATGLPESVFMSSPTLNPAWSGKLTDANEQAQLNAAKQILGNNTRNLNETYQARLADAVALMGNKTGQKMTVVSAYRDPAIQDALYAKGRTAPGAIVTNAQGGQSYHNYGLATDMVPQSLLSTTNWSPNSPLWNDWGSAAEQAGLYWGGNQNFKNAGLYDPAHTQLGGQMPASVANLRYNVRGQQPDLQTPIQVAQATQSVPDAPQVDTTLPQAPQVSEVPAYAIETDKLIADIRKNVSGSFLYSDADIVNEIVKSGVGTVNPETGKIEVTASDENGDGVVNQQDVDTVIGKLQQDYKVDPSKYWTPIGPPTQTNVAANPMMANMGIAQPPESPDVPMFASANVADVPAPVAPSGTLAHLGVYDAPIGVDPNVYASPLNLPAQPNTVLSKAINTVIGLTPLGLPNTIAGLFGSGVGDMVANAANVPMTAEEAQAAQERMFASSQGNGNFTQVASNTNVLDRVKSKARTAKRTSERWKLDALAWGFSEEQLADREVADLIKQVYDLGFIPKTA